MDLGRDNNCPYRKTILQSVFLFLEKDVIRQITASFSARSLSFEEVNERAKKVKYAVDIVGDWEDEETKERRRQKVERRLKSLREWRLESDS